MTTTHAQRVEALALANVVRLANAAICGELRALPRHDGTLRAAALLRDSPPTLGAVKLDGFLESIRGIGELTRAGILHSAGVVRGARGTLRIRDLSPTQREDVARQLDMRAVNKPSPPRDTIRRVPAAPLAKAVERLIARTAMEGDDHARVTVCARAEIPPRTLYAWTHGKRQMIQFDVADRVVTRLDLQWWDVWDDDAATQVWEGQVAA